MKIEIGEKVKVETITGGGYIGHIVEILDKAYIVMDASGRIRIHSEIDVGWRGRPIGRSHHT